LGLKIRIIGLFVTLERVLRLSEEAGSPRNFALTAIVRKSATDRFIEVAPEFLFASLERRACREKVV